MAIINSLKYSVKTTFKKVLTTAKFMIMDSNDLYDNNDLYITESSREILHSDGNQN